MDEYISRQDALEIVKRTIGDDSAAFAEISKLTIYDMAEQFYNEGRFEGYLEGHRDGEKSKVSTSVIENLGQITSELSDLKNQIIHLEQTVLLHIHTPINQPVYIQPSYPWWMKPGGYGGHGGGQG